MVGCKTNVKSEQAETLATEVKSNTQEKALLTPKLLVNLPETFNSPASGDLDKDGNVIFTSPNLHNDVLIKAGAMQKPAIPTIGKTDNNTNLALGIPLNQRIWTKQAVPLYLLVWLLVQMATPM